MILEMKVPSPGESITEVEIDTWLVSDGDYVEKDQVIAEVDSDKATLELPAEESGIITLKAEEGDAVDVGQVVCLIDTSAINDSIPEVSNQTKTNNEVNESVIETTKAESNTKSHIASPSARKIIAENNLEISNIIGTGKDGRVTKNDAVNSKPSMGSPSVNSDRKETRTKLSMLRRKVAERLVTVKNETATISADDQEKLSHKMGEFVEDIMGIELDGSENQSAVNTALEGTVSMLIDIRKTARDNKDFATSDRIRDELLALGVQLKDGKDGTGFSL